MDEGRSPAGASAAGKRVKLVHGTDLLGAMDRHRHDEFAIRGELLKPMDVIRSATSTAAELFQRQGELGAVVPGARADLLVVEGNPLEDPGSPARSRSEPEARREGRRDQQGRAG
jgi:imidazolonepropionase-like amidohydrolase